MVNMKNNPEGNGKLPIIEEEPPAQALKDLIKMEGIPKTAIVEGPPHNHKKLSNAHQIATEALPI